LISFPLTQRIRIHVRCSQIAASLDHQDFDQVEDAFRTAANLWLAGRSACRRLVANDTRAERTKAKYEPCSVAKNRQSPPTAPLLS
jgi:hypothetical protein